MADDGDYSQYMDNYSQGGSLEPAFSQFGTTGSDETANTLWDPSSSYNRAHNPEQWQQVVGNALKQSANDKAGLPGNPQLQREAELWGRSSSIGLFNEGKERVGLESTKPPQKTRALKSEDPKEIYRQWYQDMKQFGYKDK